MFGGRGVCPTTGGFFARSFSACGHGSAVTRGDALPFRLRSGSACPWLSSESPSGLMNGPRAFGRTDARRIGRPFSGPVGPLRAVRLWPRESEASPGSECTLEVQEPRRGDRWLLFGARAIAFADLRDMQGLLISKRALSVSPPALYRFSEFAFPRLAGYAGCSVGHNLTTYKVNV